MGNDLLLHTPTPQGGSPLTSCCPVWSSPTVRTPVLLAVAGCRLTLPPGRGITRVAFVGAKDSVSPDKGIGEGVGFRWVHSKLWQDQLCFIWLSRSSSGQRCVAEQEVAPAFG